ncbi:GNAT family N-acetyltransferase [Streptomyces sp. NPDC048252]|uniref:GNAT family N-acetyltransferase n=1 Tax=Streptomyces sp. NPDC048252 TaxID=3154612 RepID=UPI003435A718
MEPIRREDSDDLFAAVVIQGSVMRWLATGRADSRSAAEAMCDDHVAHWTRHGYGDFAVRDAATHAFLGRVGLRSRAQHGVDLGFALHPRAQGRGIAGEAGRACLDLALRRLSLPVVFAFVLPDNTASIAVLRRLGAQADGTVQSSGLHCLRYRFDNQADRPAWARLNRAARMPTPASRTSARSRRTGSLPGSAASADCTSKQPRGHRGWCGSPRLRAAPHRPPHGRCAPEAGARTGTPSRGQ